MKVLILQSGAYVQYCEPNFSGYSEIPTNHLILFTTNGAKIKAVKMKYNLSKGCPYCINLKLSLIHLSLTVPKKQTCIR